VSHGPRVIGTSSKLASAEWLASAISQKASVASKKTLNYLFAILQWGACFTLFFGVLGDFWAFFWSEFLVPFGIFPLSGAANEVVFSVFFGGLKNR
jgi:hypothetical protein